MKNNYMRIILCLFMCCALLFTCVARPASATSVAVVAGLAAIPAAVAVACAFQALGVMSASSSTDFTTTVNNCSNWLTNNTSLVVNGAVSLLGLTNAGVTTSYLSKDFIQTCWEWLFRDGPVSSSLPLPSVAPLDFETVYKQSLSSAYCCLVKYTKASPGRPAGSWAIVRSSLGPFSVDHFNSSIYWPSGSVVYQYSSWDSNPGWGNISNSNGAWYGNERIFYGSGYGVTLDQISASTDLLLGSIETPFQKVGTEEETIQIEIAPIYIDWTKYGVPDPNDPGGDDPDNDGKYPMWLPTGVPSPGYDDSVITQNQQQAQSGVVSGDITFKPYQPDSGGGGAGSGTDLSSVIQTIINVPTAIVSGIGNFISDFFGFNGNYDDYTVQLRDFFPFCIPFDLYDFITVLSAEPEAPVFHWEIPVPQLGQTFELEVDLSAWDDIAVLFRNLELLAFIFGLAIMTREKFLRS